MSNTPERKLGALGALLITLVVVIIVQLPAVLALVVVEALFPFAQWRFEMHWWVIPIGAVGLFASGFAVTWVKVRLPLVLPFLARPWYAAWGGEIVEMLALIAIYNLVLEPLFAAAIAGVTVSLVSIVTTPYLDDKLEEQRRDLGLQRDNPPT